MFFSFSFFSIIHISLNWQFIGKNACPSFEKWKDTPPKTKLVTLQRLGLNRRKSVGESHKVFGGERFDQLASDFGEYSWKTYRSWQKSHMVYGGLHFDQYTLNLKEYSWKTFDNWENIGKNKTFITRGCSCSGWIVNSVKCVYDNFFWLRSITTTSQVWAKTAFHLETKKRNSHGKKTLWRNLLPVCVCPN